MGLCISRPEIDDVDDEQTALLRDNATQSQTDTVPNRFANMSPEEIARIQEEERLKTLEQKTRDALINISHRADFMHGQSFSSNSRDYADLLCRFNQQIKLPLTTLVGPAEEPRRGARHADIAAVLAEGHIPDSDVELIDGTIDRIISAISVIHIDVPGDCIVPLSLQNERVS
ncbi:hypothetical protein GQ54DRAFT_297534 [Martensiomyces pterosporus]|nr:hypothetical protein GQ54DRAFT_297534 [Martensiomyces pterosporus]